MFELRPKLHKPNETGESVSEVTQIRTGKSLLCSSKRQGFLSWLQLVLRSFQILYVREQGTIYSLAKRPSTISLNVIWKVKNARAVTKLQVQGRNGL